MAEYRLNELAKASGVSARNIRAYQERGLLRRPARSGRVSVYDDSHLWTLEMITFLLQKGYTVAHIADFLDGFDKNLDLADILGLQSLAEQTGMEQIFRAPWKPGSSAEGADRPDSTLHVDPVSELGRKLVEYRIARRDGDVLVLIDDDIARRVSAGRDERFYLQVLIGVVEATHTTIGDLATVAVNELRDRLVEHYGEGWIAPVDQRDELARTITDVRELGARLIDTRLNEALETNVLRVVGEYLEGVMDQHGLTAEQLTQALGGDSENN
ncbi:MerR family transcriptional regulator [Gordonia sp. NPDC058843]|uniref:MerR family transcriptional regulator n=1 Tax=Gordonia sp. NPDC058843 TaxID=3346648 RepID=UPI0036C37538